MKGLMIKDLKSLSKQKYFFAFVLIFIVLQLIGSGSTSFLIGYFTMMCAASTNITLNYDQADNGYAFIFYHPINRSDYVAQKYLLSIIITTTAWVIGNTSVLLYGLISKTEISILELFLGTAVILFLALLMTAFMLPLQLKYNNEKARTVFMGVIGGIIAIGIIVSKSIQDPREIGFAIKNMYSMASFEIIMLGVSALTLSILFLSYLVSLRIMKNKEF
ncbi:MAG: ABC-2 transporter permease [Gallicola sp.]|nr:ABC-2 transporter permease [Gallicola sp.]